MKILKYFLTKSVDIFEMYNCDIIFFFIISCMKKLWKHFRVERDFFPSVKTHTAVSWSPRTWHSK
jgi:hypothetical protein